MNKKNFFWVGYSDLLTSLFFVMLVLFIVTFAFFKKNNEDLADTISELETVNSKLEEQNRQLELIKEVEEALSSLDQRYFEYDEVNKRYKLNVDISFRSGSDNFGDITVEDRRYLEEAGRNLYNIIQDLIAKNPKVEYLLIVEGNTQRSIYNGSWNFESIPDVGYKLSYRRALSLVNFWKNDCKIPFEEIEENCELLIAGSGYFGQSREKDENLNRRFTIQVTSKVGKLLDETS